MVLLESVEEVASRAGIDGATVAAIAEHAGIAVGTLYNDFPDRDSLLADLFRYRRGEIVPRLAAIAKETPTGSFEQQLESYLTAVLRVFDDNRKFIRIALEVDQRSLRDGHRERRAGRPRQANRPRHLRRAREDDPGSVTWRGSMARRA